ncbi:MAG: dihydrofolate reductase family protein [Thaumarchaeota archaeon]|nr:dihydrofolate reductase family protein [Nitrososphaerota archaeon]
MRKVVVSEFVTLDGVMEDPGGAEKTKHGGWSFKIKSSPDQLKFKFDELFAGGGLLLGRVTYQGFAQAWPSMKDPYGFADRMNSLPKYVVSTTLDRVEWNNSRIIRENIAEEVNKLKQQPGQDILVFGSGELARTLMRHGLVDELRLMVFPIVLGSGKRLFGEGEDLMTVMSLADTKVFESGVVLLSYRPQAEAPQDKGA